MKFVARFRNWTSKAIILIDVAAESNVKVYRAIEQELRLKHDVLQLKCCKVITVVNINCCDIVVPCSFLFKVYSTFCNFALD